MSYGISSSNSWHGVLLIRLCGSVCPCGALCLCEFLCLCDIFGLCGTAPGDRLALLSAPLPR